MPAQLFVVAFFIPFLNKSSYLSKRKISIGGQLCWRRGCGFMFGLGSSSVIYLFIFLVKWHQ